MSKIISKLLVKEIKKQRTRIKILRQEAAIERNKLNYAHKTIETAQSNEEALKQLCIESSVPFCSVCKYYKLCSSFKKLTKKQLIEKARTDIDAERAADCPVNGFCEFEV